MAAAAVIRYGSQLRLPVKEDPVSVCSARSPASRSRTAPGGEGHRPHQPEGEEPAQALEGPERLLLGVVDDELEEVAAGRGQPAATPRPLHRHAATDPPLRGAILPRPGDGPQALATRSPHGG